MIFDIGTMESRLKSKKNLRLDPKSFFDTILGLSPRWDYRPNTENNNQNRNKIKKREKFH